LIFYNILGTGVVQRIKYDTHTNSFIGFATPLSGGVPLPCHFKTDSLSELKLWMDNVEKAPLLNIVRVYSNTLIFSYIISYIFSHVIIPLSVLDRSLSSLSFSLSSYPYISGCYLLIDMVRYIYIYI